MVRQVRQKAEEGDREGKLRVSLGVRILQKATENYKVLHQFTTDQPSLEQTQDAQGQSHRRPGGIAEAEKTGRSSSREFQWEN